MTDHENAAFVLRNVQEGSKNYLNNENQQSEEIQDLSIKENISQKRETTSQNLEHLREPPIKLDKGGLTNNLYDCFINCVAQFCKAFISELDPITLEQMPILSKFLMHGLESDTECKLMRKEIVEQVITNQNQELQSSIDHEGTARIQQDATALLRLFLATAKTPQIFLEEELNCIESTDNRIRDLPPERMLHLPLPSKERVSMQEILTAELISNRL
jgi:hypothetical protein